MSAVWIPQVLRSAVGGQKQVELEGGTVRELVDALVANFPALRQQLLGENGDLNRFVNVYVNNEDVRLGDGLDTSVPAEATVIVLPAMAGGGAEH